MAGYKSETQFFHDGEVHRWVASLADADAVTIFAGAGLTIDKTGLGWRELVRQVLSGNRTLETKGYIDPAGAELVAKYLQPVEAATIAEHYYGMLFEDAGDGRTRLLQALQGLLYPGSYWQAGHLIENMLNFATTLAGTDVNVKIVTTNYETHIEDQYLAMAQKAARLNDRTFPGMSVRILDQPLPRRGPTNAVPDIELTYLHGRIPNQGHIDGDVALSEHDYYRLRGDVTKALREAFDGRAVVIAGASLTDPPLLAALEQTAGSNGGLRVAVTPLPAYDFHDKVDDHRKFDILKTHLKARMQEFGVELLFPDFYYQVAQLFDETRIARVLAGDEHYQHGGGGIRYGGRLLEWWREWSRAHLTIRDPAERAHLAVQAALDEVIESVPHRHGVRGTDKEPFRMDVWVRWNPTEDSRCLAMWANSESLNQKAHSPDVVDLDNLSELHAMQAFVCGRPVHVIDEGGRGSVRRTHLAVPIRYDGGIAPIPVGVVALSSPWGKVDTRLSGLSAKVMAKVIDGMSDVGVRLLSRETLPEQ